MRSVIDKKISLLSIHHIVTNKIIKQNDIRRHEIQKNICFYGTGKIAVSAHIISSDIRWCRADSDN